MTVKQAVGLLVCLVGEAPLRTAAQQVWLPAACDIKPGHYLVNSGLLYLKSAASTKFAEQRTKDLKDANRVLTQALTSDGQQKNPAAWYYFGRYYLTTNDLVGADSALTKALVLAPGCKDDIALYRRQAWVPHYNAAIEAWQAGNTDSAIASFRRANQIYTSEPMGLVYIADLFAGANQLDSSVKYFRLAVAAASDPKYAKDRRDALLNLARVYNAQKQSDSATSTYKTYLAADPGDVQAMAGLAALYAQAGNRDSALALYARISDHADSASAEDLFAAGLAMINAVPAPPDTVTTAGACRAAQRKKTPALTPRQLAAKCEIPAADTMRKFHVAVDPQYHLAAKAYEIGLVKNPYSRDALYNLSAIYFLNGDTSKLLPVVQRLYALDPMNKNTLAKLVGAWQLVGRKDTVLRYLQIAEALPFEVAVSSFSTTDKAATVEGLVTNGGSKPSTPVKLTWEFLDAKGGVVATQAQDVPAVNAGANSGFKLKADGAGIVAWRYRRS
jgi:tetratricopeptide (TPR) repeat protein